jgi:hypothetical protein
VEVQAPLAQNTILTTSVSPEFVIVNGVEQELLPPLHCTAPPPEVTAVTGAGSPVVVAKKLRVTAGAGAYTELPACDAVMLHSPAVKNIAMFPETAHTAGVVAAL